MTCRRPCLQEVSTLVSRTFTDIKLLAIAAILVTTAVFAQDQPQPTAPPDSAQVQVENQNISITIRPAPISHWC